MRLKPQERLMKHNRGYICHNLKVFRHLHMLSVTEFADKLGVDKKRLQEVETGRLSPNNEEVAALMKLSEYDLDILIHVKFGLEIV